MDGKTAFGPRVAYYMQARPNYPAALLACLRDEYGLTATAVIADIGCGTGKLARLFLENGNPVYGVEPDAEMRAASQTYLHDFAHFTAVAGTAEATTLPTASMDFVVAGQSAHWFERAGAEAEFQRICHPGSVVALVWNQRQREHPAIRAFDTILHTFRQPTPHLRRANAAPADVVALAGSQARLHTFPTVQKLDFEGLVARMLSISFVPLPGEAGHEALLLALRQLFAEYAENGRIHLPYTTELYVGRRS